MLRKLDESWNLLNDPAETGSREVPWRDRWTDDAKKKGKKYDEGEMSLYG